MLPRRRFMTAVALGMGSGCAFGSAGVFCGRSEIGAQSGLPVQAVAPDVYIFPDLASATDEPGLPGRGNAGFIVGPVGVVVVDTGISRAHGEAMLSAIRRVTPRPVRLVIITQPQQDFLFGSAAFTAMGIPLLCHVAAARLMRSRCPTCLTNLQQRLGETAMQGTRLVIPGRQMEGSRRLDAADGGLDVLDSGGAAIPGGLMVHHPPSGAVFAGPLLTVDRIPAIRDANLPQWDVMLGQLAQRGAPLIVPGYGPVARLQCPGSPAPNDVIAALRGYLRELDRTVRGLYASGVGLADAPMRAALPAYKDWAGYPALHRQNVHYRYLTLEAEDLAR